MTRPQGFMTTRTFKKSLNLARDLKVGEVWLHNWGEPLLHPKLNKFITLASKNFKVGFATNGTLLNYQKLRELSKAGLTFLDISLNMDSQKRDLLHMVAMYQLANENWMDCRFRAVVNNKAEYDYLSAVFKNCKIRWQRAMIRDSRKVRTSTCEAKKKVLVVLWDGTVVPCCSVVNKEIVYGQVGKRLNFTLNELENDYCKSCHEIDEDMPVRRKL